MTRDEIEAGTRAEQAAVDLFRTFVRENAESLRWVAHWGDGRAGYLAEIVVEELGLVLPAPQVARPAKVRIPRALAKRVFERDGYRCVTCGGHHDLTCDHVVPESRGGETTFENLQTMCRPCNCRKGVS